MEPHKSNLSKEAGIITKITMRERKTSFLEVSNGFSTEEALKESKRCLQCNKPLCNIGCPAGIDIKAFIGLISENNFRGAINKIREANSLPGVCGRVCPQEDQCQVECVLNKPGRPIKIGYLERFVADWELAHPQAVKPAAGGNGKKIAVIGTGPAGITCSAELAKAGYVVYLFEALHKAGGVLVYGIPEFRLPKTIVQKEVEYAQSLGVHLYTDFVVGRTMTLDDLRAEGFKAFYIAVGAGLPQFLNIPGENLNGVYSANEFLTRVNLMKSYRFPEFDTPIHIGRKIGIFGGGNVAFDCARSALRLGAEETHIIYRRTRAEMPARAEEIENAGEEGVMFDLLVTPLELMSDGKGNVAGLRALRNELSEPDNSGRRAPRPIQGSEFTLDIDTAIAAIGTKANPLLTSTVKNLECTGQGYIKINNKYQTSVPDVFAGGDIVSGSATVISAIHAGKQAAVSIHEYLAPGTVTQK